MYRLIFLTALLIQVSASTTVNAEDKINIISSEDKERVKTIALEFARCSGVYEMAADINNVTGKTALGKSTHEIANGAMIASAYLVASMGIISDWQNAMQYAENTANSEKVRWEGIFEASEEANTNISSLTESIKKCNKLGDFQSELVQEARLWAYSQQKQK